MATSVGHDHPGSWAATMDWIDLSQHLVNVHLQDPDLIEHVEDNPDGITHRRQNAEALHRQLHRTE